MSSKKKFMDNVAYELDDLIKDIQESYEHKIAKLEIDNKRLSQLVINLNTRIEKLEERGQSLGLIDLEKQTSLNKELDQIQIIKDFEKLLIKNEQEQKFHIHKLLAMWIEIIKTNQLKFVDWSNYSKYFCHTLIQG